LPYELIPFTDAAYHQRIDVHLQGEHETVFFDL
jgi:urease accessory protein UreH